MTPEEQSQNTAQTSAPQPMQSGPHQAKSALGIPIAIVLSAILISGAIIFTGQNKSPNGQVANEKNTEQETKETVVAPVSDKDHIRGNPNAPIVIVEYSDYDCPFCKNFHETMNRIMSEYGADGEVAWVYRHLPLEQLHPNAHRIAEAAECVTSDAGNDGFWKFSDLVFGERKTNEQTDITKLADYASQAGADRAKFEKCLTDGTFAGSIEEAVQAGFDAGARGTPYSILIVGDQQGVINGAQPYATVKQMIDTVIAQMKGGAE